MPLRLFVAVTPDASTREALSDVLRRLRSCCDRAGWRVTYTPPDNLHVTLQFLGSVDEARVAPLTRALETLADHPPFDVHLAGVGSFPPVGKPRVLWLGVREGTRDLAEIASRVRVATETLGFSPDERRFHPHVTLGRVKRAAGRAEDVLHPLLEVEGGTFQVREVTLYRSHLRPEGAEHVPLAKVLLGGDGGSGVAPDPELR